MSFRRFVLLFMGAVLPAQALADGAAPAPSVTVGSQQTCGIVGKPACPLQNLMRQALARPYAARNFEELARGFAVTGSLNPAPREWRDWDALAEAGRKAASVGDADEALKSCTRCHRAYRREYIARFRERAVDH